MKFIKQIFIILFVVFLCCACGEKEYYCNNDDKLEGTTCVDVSESPAEKEYYCERSAVFIYLRGDKCYSNNSNIWVYAKTKYSCSIGTLNGDKCIFTVKYPAKER